ncbi:hypothetical protein [uncultured Sphingomonas sp.]|uniref:hypothetical protein n=1 Tax=uncultured Sphingomonas sp. TaxID=158754 RepID=UPI0025F524DD|nr:hypothetical protein [uncultured Sphingomonas sp.]
MRKIALCLAATAMFATGAANAAAPCRDAQKRFVKCPEKAAAKPVRCKTAAGKFAKCGTPGAKPA